MSGVGNDIIEVEAGSYAQAQQIFNQIAMLNDPPEDTIGAEALARKGTNKDIGFYGNFGDGLALVAPTRELVDEMLKGSQRSGYNPDTGEFEGKDDVIAWLISGATLTTHDKAASKINPDGANHLDNVSLYGRRNRLFTDSTQPNRQSRLT